MTIRYRLIRVHGCPCGFRNEFPEGLVEPGQPEPVVDADELEVCPGSGCSSLVPVTSLLRLPLRDVLGFGQLLA